MRPEQPPQPSRLHPPLWRHGARQQLDGEVDVEGRPWRRQRGTRAASLRVADIVTAAPLDRRGAGSSNGAPARKRGRPRASGAEACNSLSGIDALETRAETVEQRPLNCLSSMSIRHPLPSGTKHLFVRSILPLTRQLGWGRGARTTRRCSASRRSRRTRTPVRFPEMNRLAQLDCNEPAWRLQPFAELVKRRQGRTSMESTRSNSVQCRPLHAERRDGLPRMSWKPVRSAPDRPPRLDLDRQPQHLRGAQTAGRLRRRGSCASETVSRQTGSPPTRAFRDDPL